MSDRFTAPAWAIALDDLLRRQWRLEQSVREREKSYSLPVMTLYPPVVSLNLLFKRHNCSEYRVVVERDTPNEFTVIAPNLPSRKEKRALNAVLDWLDTDDYTPPALTSEEQQELQELRCRLARAARDQLDALGYDGKTLPPGIATHRPPLPPNPSFDEEDQRILQTLEDKSPRLMTLGQIAGHSHVSEKTVSQRLNSFIILNLASRPRGKKRGATITPEGSAVLKRLTASTPRK
jgi:hypothetical protein